ncbi:hypothetical protein ACFVIM_26905 [Streptomyces sp. NPDC057638]|uniref:hypothetical protein n=1 Tax=Streptomyces sp. NPDC057638 TaxID=3346190 RepID=UPI0036765B9A
MSAQYTTFALARVTPDGGVLSGGAGRTPRDRFDFIVGGIPLLSRLCEWGESGCSGAFSAFDGVSPLAADVPPVILPAWLGALLLETPAPLDGERRILYGCSECQSLECGMVTVAAERDGDAVIWRDLAWQTTERADLARDGYHGLGPFRFRRAPYCAELRKLIAPPAPGAAVDGPENRSSDPPPTDRNRP